MLFDQVNIENFELLSWKGFKPVGRGNNAWYVENAGIESRFPQTATLFCCGTKIDWWIGGFDEQRWIGASNALEEGLKCKVSTSMLKSVCEEEE